jgi:hypothetical protein
VQLDSPRVKKDGGENVAGGDYLCARISEQLVRERANQRDHRLKKTAIEGEANVNGSRGFLLPGLYGNQRAHRVIHCRALAWPVSIAAKMTEAGMPLCAIVQQRPLRPSLHGSRQFQRLTGGRVSETVRQ